VPGFAGSKNFDSWLLNLRDNGITRQRYWGTPLPVWKCDKCNDYDVVGSVEELKQLAKKVPDDLHKPWIDDVTYPCKCGDTKKRVPDILDVWIDAGCASWNCLDYPQRTDLFERLFPADFILEVIDQIRGWFNLLFVASMVSMKKPSFKAVYMHGFVQDAKGRKMSKSLGNYILPDEVIDKYGADTLRYYMVGGANPGIDINYNFEDLKVKHRNLHILWNLQNYILDIARTNGFTPDKPCKLGVEEKYIFSRMNSSIKKMTERLDKYHLNEAPLIAEELFLELSRGYIQFVREKINQGTIDEKQLVFNVCYKVLFESLRLFSVVCPFITEDIYQNLKNAFNLKEESIFLLGWPGFDEKEIDTELEEQFETAKQIIQSVLHLREKIQMGQRWPLKEIVVKTDDDDVKIAVVKLAQLITRQTNVKTLTLDKIGKDEYIETEFKGTVVALNKTQDDLLFAEGFANEIMRRVQNLRRKSGLSKNDEIELCIVADDKLGEMLKNYKDDISKRCGAKDFDICSKSECKVNGTSSEEKIKGNDITICLSKS